MNKSFSDKNLLASLAVFRGLEEKGKSTNEILIEFLVDIIKTEKLYSFRVAELNGYLRDIYNFQIPDAVIAVTLKGIPFLKKINQIYSVENHSKLSEYNFEIEKNCRLKEYEEIFEMLCEFIKEVNQKPLDEKDKTHIEHAFSDYILDNKIDNGYSDNISIFIINNKHNQKFMDNLKTIKEGVILYTGLKYNPNFQTHKPWSNKLVIYLNMEILFHFGGYNGELFKILFNDLYKLIKEINSKKKYIFLKYLPETKAEIDSFFYSAECIVTRKMGMIAGNTAMKNIVNGCKDKLEVIAKKEKLFELLDTSGILIEEDEANIYNQENHKYNILTSSLMEKYKDSIDNDELNEIMRKLNYISIKRGEREQNNFENIGYILLTEVGKINALAWDENLKEQGQVPLTTNMQFLTNKLWFKLNKGFGDGDYPISFNLTTKAQVLLSSHISEKLNDSYLELQEKVKSGEMSQEVAIKVLFELKSRVKLPEEIYDTDMSSVMSTLDDSLEEYILEHENTINEARQASKVNKKLQSNLEQIENEKNKLSQDYTFLKESFEGERNKLSQDYTLLKESLKNVSSQNKVKEKQITDFEEKLLNEKNKRFMELKKKKNKLEEMIDKKYLRLKIYSTTIIILLIANCVKYFDFNEIASIASILSLAPLVISILYMIFFEKSLNPIEILRNKKNKIKIKIYSNEDFDENEIKLLEKEIEELKN